MIEFVGELDLRLIQSSGKVPTKGGRVRWRVRDETEPHCVWNGATIYLERDSETDLASIPRVAWGLLPPDGAWLLPAVFHDALYRQTGNVARIGHPLAFTKAEADRLFLDGMRHVGVSRLKRSVIYRAVRLAGAWGT